MAGVDTAYVADDRGTASGGGVQKWIFNGTTWSLTYTLNSGLTAGARGVTVDASGANPVVYATTADGSKLVKVIDAGAGSAFTTLATAGTNKIFRGVAFAPASPVATPTVSLSVSTSSASEAAATVVTVTATASSAVSGPQTVDVSVGGTNITAGDYALGSATITIPHGGISGSVTFTVIDDAAFEGAETATLTLSNPSSGVTIGSPDSQDVTIVDNDAPPAPSVSLLVDTTSGSEATAIVVTVTATASAAVVGEQTVGVAVSGTNITAGDYSLSSSTISIASGSTTGSVTFTVVDDALFEGPETATLTLSGPSAGLVLASSVSQDITIVDNEGPPNANPAIGAIGPLSGVISDPTNPAAMFTVSDAETDVNALTVAATATSNPAVAPLGGISFGGAGALRSMAITPAAIGYANITVTVTDGGGAVASTVLSYAASQASVNPATTRFHTGASDASTATAIDADTMLVADDENQTIRLYARSTSGAPLNAFDFNAVLGLTDFSGGQPREVDIEASARIGDRIYCAASQGNSSSGALRPNRYRLFATDLTVAGASSTLAYAGRYDHLRGDLMAWDAGNGHGLGANHYGLAASAASGVAPEVADASGFNLEGMTVAPDGTTVYLAFRAPLVPTGARAHALIVPLTNIEALLSMGGSVAAGSAAFGAPIELALGHRGIRTIDRNAAGDYLLVAGPPDTDTGAAPKDFRLFTWTGLPGNAPVMRAANLTGLVAGGAFEGLVEVPSSLTPASEIQVVVDNGDTIFYTDDVIAKELPIAAFKKFRSERIVLGAEVTESTSPTPGPGDIIFNEYASDNDANGNDFFELLILRDGLDLRGLRVSDNEVQPDGSLNINEGVFVFGNDAYLQNVPAGTLIAVYSLAVGVVTDTVANPAASDWKMVLAPGTGVTTGSDGLGGSFNAGFGNGGDALYLYLPGPNGTSAGTDNVYLDFISWEGGGSPAAAAPAGIAFIDLPSLADNAYYVGSSAAGNDNPSNWTRYDGAPNGNTTPGLPNPSQNLSGLQGSTLSPGVTVTQSGGSTVVTEAGGTDSYTLALRTAPAGAVQIQATSDSQTEVSLDGSTWAHAVALSLTNTTASTIFVRALDDAVVEGAATSTIAHSIVLSADPSYGNGVTPVGAVTANVTDDDFDALAIHDIQGTSGTSPVVGQVVTTLGIVTARKVTGSSSGFYIQIPDAQVDADPLTSEGLFVFTGSTIPADAQVGHRVAVTGRVLEFIPTADPGSPSTTEIGNSPSVTLLSTGHPLPSASVLTAASMQPGLAPFEAFEGMRVSMSLNVISPTDGFVTESSATSTSSGVFYGVLPGVARPFREPGIEIGDPAPSEAVSPPTLPRFDGNGERIRVEMTTLGGSTLDVTSFATVSGLTGVFDFRFRASTLLVEPSSTPSVTGMISATPARLRSADEFTVGSFNMERFFDTSDDAGVSDVVLTAAAFERRLAKASLAIRDVMRAPDVIGIEEMDNLSTLQTLADRVNADAVAASQLGISYIAYLENGNDVGGIDVGFLVNIARVNVLAVTQVGKTATYLAPGSSTPALLNDRPSLVLRAQMVVPGYPSYPVTVIVNHLRSLSGIDDPSDPADALRIRAKRRAQAEWLASYIQSRQVADPAERIISVGDYNAFQINDGLVDSIGTILGTPTHENEVALASSDLVEPNLVDLVNSAPLDQRYSYLFDGNAQEIDHIIVTSNLAGSVSYGRSNTDFPEIYRNDATRPERISDHDMIIGYFPLAPDTTAPVVTVPGGMTLEATGSSTVVSFTVTATDNLDGAVTPSCTPASGAGFAVGETEVSCTAADAHGNTSAPATFTVTVTDTTAPALTVPGTINANATDASGAMVIFTASATDLVDGTVIPVCVLPSGSTFPLGSTTVACTATDAHGNIAAGTFDVSVIDAFPPVVTVPNDLAVDASSAAGAIVTFAATAQDDISGDTVVICSPPSGDTFPIGETLVSCTSTDAAGHTGSALFRVTVADMSAPVLSLPSPIVVTTGNLAGVVVTFFTSAVDAVDGSRPVSCTPVSGSTFAVGTTTVECSSADTHSNTAIGSFAVTVTYVNPNHAPVANPDSATTLEGAAVTIAVLANDTDVDAGDVLAIGGATTPTHGTTSLVAGGVRYTPAAGFAGSDAFDYTVSDGHGGSAIGHVTVKVSRIGRFVALGEDQMWLRARSTVLTGDVGANTPIAGSRGRRDRDDDGENDRTVEVRIGEQARVLQAGSRVVGDTVWLRRDASIVDVLYNELENRRGTVHGTSTHPVALPFVAMPSVPTVNPGTQSITVARNATTTLGPGRYGRVQVKAKGTLVLTGGLYQVLSLDVDQDATVLFKGAVDLRIKTELDTDAKSKLIVDGTVAGLSASKILITVLGGDHDCQHDGRGDDGDEAGPTVVHIGADNVIQATIYAPNGTLWIRAKTTATGAFLGERVRIGERVTLTLDSAFR